MKSSRCQDLPFHNWQHTMDVVRNSNFLANLENLPEESIEELIIASYFHDVGNIKGASGHEKMSCEIAQEFLIKEGYPKERIVKVIRNIKATEMPQHPKTISEKIICDADLAHLGNPNFFIKNAKLRKEWERFNDLTFTDEQWAQLNTNFLSTHSFYTNSAYKSYGDQKMKNLSVLKNKILS